MDQQAGHGVAGDATGTPLDGPGRMDAEWMYREAKRATGKQVDALVELEQVHGRLQEAWDRQHQAKCQAEKMATNATVLAAQLHVGGSKGGENWGRKRRRHLGEGEEEEGAGTDAIEAGRREPGETNQEEEEVSFKLAQCTDTCMELMIKVGELHRDLQELNRRVKGKRKGEASEADREEGSHAEEKDARAVARSPTPSSDPVQFQTHVPSPKRVDAELPSNHCPSNEESEDFSGGSLL